MQDIALEESSARPVFLDKGSYQIIDGGTGNIERGAYSIDTRPANQMGNKLDWESLIHLKPEFKLTTSIEDMPHAYSSVGEVLRLWKYEVDPQGNNAKTIHNKILALIQRGIPIDQLIDEIRDEIIEFRDELE